VVKVKLVVGRAESNPQTKSAVQALLVISCQLAKTILKETEEVVNVDKIVWVDSTAVYNWVKNRPQPEVNNNFSIHKIKVLKARKPVKVTWVV
jgi:hypothetical protein